MLVRDIMTSPVVSIEPDITLEEAYRTMQLKGIRHLPVVAGGKLVGVITDRDLRLATSTLASEPFKPGSRVAGSMCRAVETADAMDPVEEAARKMRAMKIGCLPVVDDGRLVGIVTGLDLLDALMRMTGADKPSGRLEVRMPDQPGELARLTALVSERDLNVHSILTYPDGPNRVRTVLRIGSIEMRQLAQEMRQAGFEVLWPPEKPCPR
jgi:acetoin utilization protein AcuB